ncbi:MAG: hypothetical protein PUD59_00430 [bacterium]|nr:hypothetical protein [bacterium]
MFIVKIELIIKTLFLVHLKYGEKVLRTFRTNDRPVIQQISNPLSIIFNASIIETGENISSAVNNVCPPGYEDSKLCYKITQQDGTNYGLGKLEYNINLSNNEIGKFRYWVKTLNERKLLFFKQSYEYWELNYKGQQYLCYFIKSKKVGIVCTVYQNNKQVALIKRSLKVINYLDNYSIYMENGFDIDAIFLIACHFDYTDVDEPFMPQGIPDKSYHVEKNGNSFVECRKELLSKFDPNFEKRIIEQFVLDEEKASIADNK